MPLLAFALAAIFLIPQESHAQTDVSYARDYALDRPAHITPRALNGLFTSVALAGSRLVAVGERGRIVLSDDNGVSWRQVPSPTSVTLTHVTFPTPSDGWAVGGMGVVLHSSNGGLTWTRQLNGIRAANIALSAAQADITHYGTNDLTSANLQAAQAMIAAGPSVPFLDVFAISSNKLIVAGAFGMAFSSADSGATWRSLADLLPNPNGLHIYQIVLDGDNLALVGEQGLMLYGPLGKPLATINAPFQGTLFGEVLAADHSWVAYGLQGTILRSTDHGVHWTLTSAGQPVGIDCGIILRSGDLLLGNEAGQILMSQDNGKSFHVSQTDEPVVGMVQAADGSVILVGPNGPKRTPADKFAAGA